LALTAAVVLLWLPASAAAQESLARTPDGQPDIQGVWNRRVTGMATYSLEGGGNEEHILLSGGCAQGIVGCERPPEEIRAQAEKRRNEYVTIITDPPGGKLPYLPWAAAKRQGIAANHTNPRGPGDIDPMARCFPVGVPRATYHEVTGMQIHQVREGSSSPTNSITRTASFPSTGRRMSRRTSSSGWETHAAGGRATRSSST
jgi:hypothetical protein